jgi:hypothetical protein
MVPRSSAKDRWQIPLGSVLIVLGLAANQWVLAALFSPDGQLSPTSRMIIWTAQILCILAGLLVLRRRRGPRIPTGMLTNIALLISSVLIILIAGEFALRLAGYQPWRVIESNVAAKSGDHFFAEHPTLGFTQLPGEFEISLTDDYEFRATNLSGGLRATHPVDASDSEEKKDEIWIFGGSVTYGWSLDDEETYPWLLQQRFPEYEIVNFGVCGYGPLHGFIQFQEALKAGRKPKLVVLTYASYHDQRNTVSREFRKFMTGPWNKVQISKLPYARFDSEGNLVYGMTELGYREFPFMRYSALAHFLEMSYNTLQERFILRSHEVSKAIIDDFYKAATENGVELVVAGIWLDDLTEDVLATCRSQGIKAVNIGVDYGIPENLNLPYDDHPSAYANRQYAQALETFLREEVLDE